MLDIALLFLGTTKSFFLNTQVQGTQEQREDVGLQEKCAKNLYSFESGKKFRRKFFSSIKILAQKMTFAL